MKQSLWASYACSATWIMCVIMCASQNRCAQHSEVEKKVVAVFKTLTRCNLLYACCIPAYTDTDLYAAVSSGNIGLVDKLLSLGIEIDCQSCFASRTPLMTAINGQKLEIAEYLINKGASPFLVDIQQSTPLHYVAAYGNQKIAQLLLQRGADVNAVDREGYNPLRRAVMCHQLSVACILMGADVHDGSIQTALMIAMAQRYQSGIKALLQRGICLEVSHIVSDDDYELQDMYHKERFLSIQSALYAHRVPDDLIGIICAFSNVKRCI